MSIDNTISKYIDYLTKQFDHIECTESILSYPLDKEYFSPDLSEGEWLVEEHNVKESAISTLKVLAIEALFIEWFNNYKKSCSANTTQQEKNIDTFDQPPTELRLMYKFCGILDMIYYCRSNLATSTPISKVVDPWTTLYFQSIITVFQLFPNTEHQLIFIKYVFSRIEWLKQGKETTPLKYGFNNLSGIRAPLSSFLLEINNFIKKLSVNNKFNTLLDNRLVMQFQWLISQLCTLDEGVNTNKECLVAKSNASTNGIDDTTATENNITQGNSVVTNDAKLPPFIYDYLHIKTMILDNPFNAFTKLEHDVSGQTKYKSFSKRLNDFIKFLIGKERTFYETVERNKQDFFSIQNALNKQICSIGWKYENMRKPLPPNIELYKIYENAIMNSLFDVDVKLDKKSLDFNTLLQNSKSDFHRKYIIIRLFNVLFFYKNLYEHDDLASIYLSKNLDLEEKLMVDKNSKIIFEHLKELSLTNIKTISDFYRHYDPVFIERLEKLFTFESKHLLMERLNFNASTAIPSDMKPSTMICQDIIGTSIDDLPRINYSFKKKSFIKLGDSKINNIWKIGYDLDSDITTTGNNDDVDVLLYNELKSKYDFNQEGAGDSKSQSDDNDSALQDWRYLRLLRNKHLFEFNQVDERTGINGLFDSKLIEQSIRDDLDNQAHLDKEQEMKIKEAQGYIETIRQRGIQTQLEKVRKHLRSNNTSTATASLISRSNTTTPEPRQMVMRKRKIMEDLYDDDDVYRSRNKKVKVEPDEKKKN
ncbi:Hpr1p SCDLUD_001741 [Saccharomycodes ludwigii]|uniref:Hpr1p n=1 Tax=Saccharomycodes ludwigii TaxID=36035 RepID=UPI001E8A5BDF|nr:hypothetical protein SCDLUD_001741 [Saccharomycodes ludwigii]KAH3901955.1 hypothetical protein SCDLUD_001741 [Saccharomycodes ludwigii]